MAAAVALAGIVAAVVLAGRESRGLRWIAYTGFAIELCAIYGVMIQDMLGTAGFFLAAGILWRACLRHHPHREAHEGRSAAEGAAA